MAQVSEAHQGRFTLKLHARSEIRIGLNQSSNPYQPPLSDIAPPDPLARGPRPHLVRILVGVYLLSYLTMVVRFIELPMRSAGLKILILLATGLYVAYIARALYRGRPWTQVWLVLVLTVLAAQIFVPLLLLDRTILSVWQVLEFCLDLCVVVLRSLPTVDRWYENRQ